MTATSEFFHRWRRDRYVVIEEWEVKPPHVPARENFAQSSRPQIGGKIVIHSLAAHTDDNRAKINIAEQSLPQTRRKVVQVVLITNLNQVRTLRGKDRLNRTVRMRGTQEGR